MLAITSASKKKNGYVSKTMHTGMSQLVPLSSTCLCQGLNSAGTRKCDPFDQTLSRFLRVWVQEGSRLGSGLVHETKERALLHIHQGPRKNMGNWISSPLFYYFTYAKCMFECAALITCGH